MIFIVLEETNNVFRHANKKSVDNTILKLYYNGDRTGTAGNKEGKHDDKV